MNIIEFEKWAREAIIAEKAKGFLLQSLEWGIVDDDGQVNCGCLQTILVKHKLGNKGAVKLCTVDDSSENVEDKMAADALGIDVEQSTALRQGFDYDILPIALELKPWCMLGRKLRKEFAVDRKLLR